MSPLDTAFGWVLVAPLAAFALWSAALVLVALCRAAAKPMPQPTEYEASPYGPIRRFNIHPTCQARGHQYGISEDGTHWVCARGDDRVPVDTDLDQIENYANGEVA